MKQPGYTLVELTVVVALAAILAGVALPAISHWVTKVETRTVAAKLALAIRNARMAAVHRNAIVVICGMRDGRNCDSGWQDPLYIFEDLNADARRDDGERLLAQVNVLPEGGRLTWSSFGSNRYLAFRPGGYTAGNNGSMTYCPPGDDPRYAHQLIIARTGRLRLATDSDGDGIRETAGGRPLQCS